jgi:transcriptional regulator with XRE-family HTH domain
MVGMNQNAISRLESEWYGRPTISTLKRLAAALDVALVVRFVPFSQLIDWVSGTPFVDSGLSTSSLAVPSFAEEMNKEQELEQELRIVGSNEINNASSDVQPFPPMKAENAPMLSTQAAGG